MDAGKNEQQCIKQAFETFRRASRKNSFYLGKENGMGSIVQKLLNTDIHILNAHLEEILRGLNRNLNTSLALTNLLIKIHREIQSDKTYA